MQKEATSTALQWDDVRHFLTLAQHGSLSAAARRLRVEHSTVARRVEALEKTLGIRLFDRLPRGWILTPEGETLANQAGRMEDEALAFSRLALGVSALQGTVRLSAPPAIASHFLVPRLLPLRQDWPGIDLEIVGESRQANLARGEADLAVRLSRPSAAGLAARPLGQLGYGLYAVPDYTQRPVDAWQFLGYDDSLRQAPQQQWLDSIAAGRRFILRSNDLTVLLQGARAGFGIAALPHFLGAGDPALVPVPVPATPCPTRRPIWLVMHPDVRRSPRVRAVADGLVSLFRSATGLLTGDTGENA